MLGSKPPLTSVRGIRPRLRWICPRCRSRASGAIELHDPAEFAATGEVLSQEHPIASLEELRAIARETEIDFDELTRNVNDLLTDLPSCTVADVLARYPATQGVGSVVGLLAIAAEQGTVDDEPEVLVWQGSDGVARAALVAAHQIHRSSGMTELTEDGCRDRRDVGALARRHR